MSAEISYLFPKNKRSVWTPELEVMDGLDSEALIEVPLLGFIKAGQPIERVEQHEAIAVPETMVSRNTYALKVRGHSMVDDNIQDGDVVIIEKTESATNGQSVVCLINNEQVTLKKFYIEKTGIRLQPANPDMEPIFLKNEEVQILGVVSGVVRTFH